MIETIANAWAELKTTGMTALFNPVFLFLLIVLFFAGRLLGWLIKSVNLWRLLAFGFFAIFLYRPLMDAGLIIGGVFILGVMSSQMERFRRIFGGKFILGSEFFGWFHNLWDRYLIRRNDQLEGENAELREELRRHQEQEQQARRLSQRSGQGHKSSSRDRWRREAKQRAKSANDGDSKAGEKKEKQSSGRGRDHKSGQSRGQGSSRRKPEQKSKPQKDPLHQSSGRGNSDSSTKKPRSSRRGSRENREEKTTQGHSSSQQKKRAQPKAGANRSGAKGQAHENKEQKQSHAAGNKTKPQQSSGPGSLSQAAQNAYLKELGIPPDKNYTRRELRAAWAVKIREAHPDKGGSVEEFEKVNNAFRRLTL